jgi:hypothetical protein
VVVLAVTVAMAACSSHPDPRGAAPPKDRPAEPAAAKSGGDLREPRLPLDRYVLSDQQLTLVESARDAAMARCMAADGFGYPRRREPVVTPRNTRRYGLTSMSSARRYGYHPPAELLGGQRWSARLDAYEASLSSAGVAALTGTGTPDMPPDGCSTTGNPSRGLPPAPTWLPFELGASTLEAARRDPLARAAAASWSACMTMARDSLRYADPDALMSDRRWWSSQTPSTDELRTAVVDVGCKQRTGYVETMAAVESSLQAAAIARHRPELDRVLRYNTALVAAARRLTEARP